MSKSIRVRSGDTPQSIARQVYGDETKSDLIERANPGSGRVLQEGSTVVAPRDPSRPLTPTKIGVNSITDVAISIDGQRFRSWSDVSISLSMDSVATATFNSPFSPDDPIFIKSFKPFAYPEISIHVGGEQFFDGTLVAPSQSISAKERTVSASCYSVAGVLSDCTASASDFPLEWNNATLETIASSLCKPFGIHCDFPDGAGQAFERQSLEYGKKIMEYLTTLASQRNMIITSTNNGGLTFYKPKKTGDVVATIREGFSPYISGSSSYDPQKFYSHITGLTPTLVGLGGVQHTVKNTYLEGKVRPYVFEASDVEDAHIVDAVLSKSGRMFSSAVEYTIEVATWLDSNGSVWSSGSFIKLISPSLWINSEKLFQIRSVELTKSSRSETATLTLALPGAMAGELPESMPWDD